MANEKVSVIVVAAQRHHRLNSAVESVLHQSYDNWELIIVDEGSELVGSHFEKHPNIKLVQQSFRGIASAWNAGIGSASGEYIAFLNADDTWAQAKLAAQADVLSKFSDVSLCYTDFESTNVENDKPSLSKNASSKRVKEAFDTEILDFECFSARIYKPKEQYRDVAALAFLQNRCMPISTVMIRRNCLPYTGLFDPMLMHASSCDMWIKILRYFLAAKVMRCDVFCFAQESNSGSGLDRSIFDHGEIYSKYVRYGTATANAELVAMAKSLLSCTSIHDATCHRFA